MNIKIAGIDGCSYDYNSKYGVIGVDMYCSIPNWSDWFFSPTRCKGAFSPETLQWQDICYKKRTGGTESNLSRLSPTTMVSLQVRQVRLLGWIFVISESEPLRAFWATDLSSVSRRRICKRSWWKVGLKRKQSTTAPGNIACPPSWQHIIVFYSRYKHQTLPSDRVHHSKWFHHLVVSGDHKRCITLRSPNVYNSASKFIVLFLCTHDFRILNIFMVIYMYIYIWKYPKCVGCIPTTYNI